MKKIAWTTDIHLDRLIERDYAEYIEYLRELNTDLLVISGDIGEGEHLCKSLKEFDDALNYPVYFVLGNHDFYFSNFAKVEEKVKALVSDSARLNWLSEIGIVELNESTALIGIEGWGDGRNGTLNLSEGSTRDFVSIADYKGLNREQIADLLKERGEKYAAMLSPVLAEAIENYQNIYLVMHVPPFAEACYDRNLRICGEYKLPFYSCKAVGDLLFETMNANPNKQMTVLCGHLHEKAEVKILENLLVRVKESDYGSWWDATMISIN